MKSNLNNPILPGFNPDPSIIRVGDDYYIATSTFEWFPGVQIHHSSDLANWELIHRPLERLSQLNMTGNPDSGGIWAPCLSHCNDTFFLVFTDVKELRSNFKASRNYLVTSDTIDGRWSDPIPLPISGFDSSLFHDPNGLKYLTWLIWDDRPGNNPFSGIMLQQYDHATQRLVGEARKIFDGTSLGCTEGPHLYYNNGYYYLITAEGGTGWDHAVTLARSRSIEGPYEVCPNNPILTSKGKSNAALKRAGHGSLVETGKGDWYLAHLCSRPIPHRGCSNMGRETALQKVRWTDEGWLELHSGDNAPETKVPLPNASCPSGATKRSARFEFDSQKLPIDFQTLRLPLDESHISLVERPGYLRLRGGLPFCTRGEQAFVARRQQSARFTATTSIDFSPGTFQQRAGLVYYYNSKNYYYAAIAHDEELGRVLQLAAAHNEFKYHFACPPISLPETGEIHVRSKINYEDVHFSYSLDGQNWLPLGGAQDATYLSDESAGAHENFTGAFIGLCCQDLTGNHAPADFAFFEYKEREDDSSIELIDGLYTL